MHSEFAMRWPVRDVTEAGTLGDGWAQFAQLPQDGPDDAHGGAVAIDAQLPQDGPEDTHGGVVAIDAQLPQDGPEDTHGGVVAIDAQFPQDGPEGTHGGVVAIDAQLPQDGPEDTHGGVVAIDAHKLDPSRVWAGVGDILRETRLGATVPRLTLGSLHGRAVVVCPNAQTQRALTQPQWAGVVEDAFLTVIGAALPVEFVVGGDL